MNLKLIRQIGTAESTVGSLFLDGKFECFTLEDVERDKKIWGVTAIPPGSYQVIITDSIRFKQPLPLLVAVPGYQGVRIHAGNTAENTEGCILVGRTKTDDFIGESRAALRALLPKIASGLKQGKVFIEVVGRLGVR